MLGLRRKQRLSPDKYDEESLVASGAVSHIHFGGNDISILHPQRQQKQYHHHHADPLIPIHHRHRRRKFIWIAQTFYRSWWTRIVVSVIVLNNIIFSIRYFTMSRPSWLYGSPMDPQHVQACLGESESDSDSDGHHTTSTLPTDTRRDESVYMEWHRFHSANSTILHPSRHRLLIAQYSGYGKYAEMLDLIAPINAAYAKHWGNDYVILQGTAHHFPGIRSSCPNEPRSTFNKIPLLQLAYDHREAYDRVLILDTDAMIVDFEVDISSLLPSTHLLSAHRVWSLDWRNTWDINAGITLWNTHHSSLFQVLEQWQQRVMENPFLVVERNDDQYFLQLTLLQLGFWNRAVYSLTQEFQYYEASVIKHFKRDARSWSRTSLEQRLLRIQETIQDMKCLDDLCQYPMTTKFSDRQPNKDSSREITKE